jgi:hypothetical protein
MNHKIDQATTKRQALKISLMSNHKMASVGFNFEASISEMYAAE